MNKKTLTLLALPAILTGCANLTHVGKINDTEITTLTTRGVFSPSSRTVFGHVPGQPGIEVLATATGPGFVPAVATAGGIAGGAALLRPARTSVHNDNSSKTANELTQGGASATAGSGVTVTVPPPSNHPNSPGNGGQPGNGGANNPNN